MFKSTVFKYLKNNIMKISKNNSYKNIYETIDFTPNIFNRYKKPIYAKNTLYPKNKNIPYKEQYETTDMKK